MEPASFTIRDSEPADIPDHPAEHQLLRQRLVKGEQRLIHFVAIEQVHGYGPGGEERTELQQPDRRG